MKKINKIAWPTLLFILAVHLISLLGFVYYSWSAFYFFFLFYFITVSLGIGIGFHRLLTHGSFEAPKWLKYILTVCGILALQQSSIEWVATHRQHHAYADTDKDPHSPKKGFWWSHVGWLWAKNESYYERLEYKKWCPHLLEDPIHKWFQKYLLIPNTFLAFILADSYIVLPVTAPALRFIILSDEF